MDELTLAGELLDEIEFVPVCRQHGNANLCRGQKNQRIVQALLTLIRLKPLRSGQRASDDAGIRPDLRIRRHQPAWGNAGEQFRVMILDRQPTRPRWICVGDTTGEFRKGDRAVEQECLVDDSRTSGARRPAAWLI